MKTLKLLLIIVVSTIHIQATTAQSILQPLTLQLEVYHGVCDDSCVVTTTNGQTINTIIDTVHETGNGFFDDALINAGFKLVPKNTTIIILEPKPFELIKGKTLLESYNETYHYKPFIIY